VAELLAGKSRGPSGRHHAGQDLRGEGPLKDRDVQLSLSPAEADKLHSALEEYLESGNESPEVERAYRLLGWRILAARTGSSSGSGLTARLASIAREAGSLEEFEAARDEELGPIMDRLESPENRDP
jgi:hypothetical protein